MARRKTHSRPSRSRRRHGRTALLAASSQPFLRPGRSARRLVGRRVLALLVVAVLIWVGWEVFRSSLFRITHFRVLGNESVSQGEIVQAAGLQGQSIFLADFAAAAERVQQLPGIQSARVRGELPDYCNIEVLEREPQLIWQAADTGYWVDGEGVILTPGETPARAVIIVDTTARPVHPGDRVDEEAVRTVQQLDRLLPSDLRPTYYEYAPQTGITLPGPGGWRACFGTSERLEAKVQILRAILDQRQAQGLNVTYIDLRPGKRPYVR